MTAVSAVSAETGTNPDLIELRDLEFSFGDRPVHRGISLKVPRGQVVVIIGPSGCGKSTILNLIGGRLFADRGSVLVDGENVAKLSRRRLFDLRKRMGMMFQNSALLTDLTVFENVAFPVRENTSLPDSIIRDLVLLKLQMVGLRGARSLYPDECSGGMQRRVALARAIALDPMLVMYDEPFTGLDPIAKGVIVKLIREVNDAIGMTSVVVTHDVAEGVRSPTISTCSATARSSLKVPRRRCRPVPSPMSGSLCPACPTAPLPITIRRPFFTKTCWKGPNDNWVARLVQMRSTSSGASGMPRHFCSVSLPAAWKYWPGPGC